MNVETRSLSKSTNPKFKCEQEMKLKVLWNQLQIYKLWLPFIAEKWRGLQLGDKTKLGCFVLSTIKDTQQEVNMEKWNLQS